MNKKWITIASLVLAAGVGSWFYFKPQAVAPSFQAVQVTRHDISVTIPSTGVVAPENRVEIKPPIPGRVEEVLVQEGDPVKKGQIIAWMSSTERSALLDLARVKGDKELSHWETLYKPTPLISPITGTVISRLIQPGQTVSQDTILVLSDHLIINAQVDETDIGKIKTGQDTEMTLDAYPKSPFSGKVDRIAYEAQTINNVTIYTVYVYPDPTIKFLKSGMTTDVVFTLESKNDVLTIPVQALVHQKGHKAVVITDISNKEKPVRTKIETGITDGKMIEVTQGLPENSTVYIPQTPVLHKKKGGSNPFGPPQAKPGAGRKS